MHRPSPCQPRPLSFVIPIDTGWSFYLARRYDEALKQYRKALEIEPKSPILHYISCDLYEQKGMYGEAVEEYLAGMQGDGFSPEQIAPLKKKYITSGYEGFKHALLRNNPRRQKYRLSSVEIAGYYAFLDDRNEPFALLQKALNERDADLVYLKFNPTFDNLHGDPRYTDLLRRMNLEP